MAKDEAASNEAKGATDTAPATAAAPAATTEAAPAAPKADTRFITLTLDAQAVTDLTGVNKADGTPYVLGDKVKRKDYILTRWGQKIGRGPIATELTRLEGKTVAYQIVFQATGKVPGGPDKPVAAPAAPAPATGEATPAAATPAS